MHVMKVFLVSINKWLIVKTLTDICWLLEWMRTAEDDVSKDLPKRGYN